MVLSLLVNPFTISIFDFAIFNFFERVKKNPIIIMKYIKMKIILIKEIHLKIIWNGLTRKLKS